jgi:hypothetical protein
MKYIFDLKPKFLFSILIFMFLAGAAFSQTIPQSTKGTVTSISASSLTLKIADGTSLNVLFDDKTRISLRTKVNLADIKAGDPLGVTSAPAEDGTMTAKAITIFPPGLLEQIRNGQFPMGNSGNTMTNAEVAQYTAGVSGHTLKMKLAEGISNIQVPDGIPIERLKIMKKTDLKMNFIVTARGQINPDGSMAATNIEIN